jgi:hypothetical protein
MTDKYEAKAAYAEKRMAENAKIETLNAEQHDALSWLCGARHKIHSNSDLMWNVQSGGYDELWALFDDERDDSINNRLSDAELTTIQFEPNEDISCSSDYELILDDDEREEWEKRANELNESGKTKIIHSGYTLWMEDGGAYEDFINSLSNINKEIEKYLARVDTIHGTNYCPTGHSRLY